MTVSVDTTELQVVTIEALHDETGEQFVFDLTSAIVTRDGEAAIRYGQAVLFAQDLRDLADAIEGL